QNYIKDIKDGNISSLRDTLFSTANRRAELLHFSPSLCRHDYGRLLAPNSRAFVLGSWSCRRR
ncbi:unnamed protein product, partial [Porites lobata]